MIKSISAAGNDKLMIGGVNFSVIKMDFLRIACALVYLLDIFQLAIIDFFQLNERKQQVYDNQNRLH